MQRTHKGDSRRRALVLPPPSVGLHDGPRCADRDLFAVVEVHRTIGSGPSAVRTAGIGQARPWTGRVLGGGNGVAYGGRGNGAKRQTRGAQWEDTT
jgi:hypothetical protein